MSQKPAHSSGLFLFFAGEASPYAAIFRNQRPCHDTSLLAENTPLPPRSPLVCSVTAMDTACTMSRNTLQYAMDAVSHHYSLDDASRIPWGALLESCNSRITRFTLTP